MIIRFWSQEDIPSVQTIENTCFATPLSLDMLKKEFANPDGAYLVAEVEGNVVGYAGYWSVVDEAQVMNVAVLPDYRRCGIGQALIRALCQTAQENHLASMSLEVRESNLPAIKLYEKMGFYSIGERKNYYRDNRETAIIMEKKFEGSLCV